MQRTTVFVSYSHDDAIWLERLRVHLTPLEREGRIELWDDTRIRPGSAWRDEIKQALESARVAVLLVSAHFLASDFVVRNELPPLLKAAKEDGATILPVIVGDSLYTETEGLKEFQAVNDPAKPLVDMKQGSRDKVFLRVARAVKEALSESQTDAPTATSRPGRSRPAEDVSPARPAPRHPDRPEPVTPAGTPRGAPTGIQVFKYDDDALRRIGELALGAAATRVVFLSSGVGSRTALMTRLVGANKDVELYYQDPATAPDRTDAQRVADRLAELKDHLIQAPGKGTWSLAPHGPPSSIRAILVYDKAGRSFAAQMGWYAYLRKPRHEDTRTEGDIRVEGLQNPSLVVTADGEGGRILLSFLESVAEAVRNGVDPSRIATGRGPRTEDL